MAKIGMTEKSFHAEETGAEVKPLRSLTAKQRRLVEAFISGPTAGNMSKSAVVAGYPEGTAGSVASVTLRLPHVQNAIDEALRKEIGGVLTSQSVALMRAVINDADAPLKLRVDTAAKIVEYSGIVDRVRVEKARQTGLDGTQAADKRRLGEMTREELEAVCRTGASILAAAAALPPAGATIEGTSAPESGGSEQDLRRIESEEEEEAS